MLQNPTIPVILDPVLAAGGGASLANEALITAIVDNLLPCTTVLTPNGEEARRLAQQDDLAECGQFLLSKGCDFVLITGADEQSTTVNNQLFQASDKTEIFSWDRLKGSYHGSGCTLASSIAATRAAPEEIPTRRPSSFAARRAIVPAASSATFTS